MQGWYFGKGLIYYRPIFQLTKLAFPRARVIPRENISKYKDLYGKKPNVSVTYENERISITKQLTLLKICVSSGRLMGCNVNGLLSLYILYRILYWVTCAGIDQDFAWESVIKCTSTATFCEGLHDELAYPHPSCSILERTRWRSKRPFFGLFYVYFSSKTAVQTSLSTSKQKMAM